MVVKLNRLPPATQKALSPACLRRLRAAFALLATVCETSQEDLHDSLWEAIRAGLVLRSEDFYAFQHDRIQEAAYSLIPEDARAEAHLADRQARCVAHTPPEKRRRSSSRSSTSSTAASSLIDVARRTRAGGASSILLARQSRAKNAAAYVVGAGIT